MLFSDRKIVPTIKVQCNDFIAEWLRFPRRREQRNRTVSVPRVADGLRLAPTGKADQNSEIAIDSADNSQAASAGEVNKHLPSARIQPAENEGDERAENWGDERAENEGDERAVPTSGSTAIRRPKKNFFSTQFSDV